MDGERRLMSAPQPGQQSYRFSYHGDGGSFFVLLLKNILLTVVTLGIYAAWAKTARRKYIWSNAEIHGQRLVYTGTGEEVFIAYLKLFGCYLLFFGLPTLLQRTGMREVGVALQIIFALVIVALIPLAIYWSRSYLLSRTQWRGIRFGLVGSAKDYAKTFILGYLLTIITLGIYGPFWMNNLYEKITNNSRLGTEPFRYDGKGKEVFWISFKGVLLTIVTLGIYFFWMQAALGRYYISHTSLSGARGKSEITGGFLFQLFLINLFGTTLTLGLAFPWISTYSLREIFQRITFQGHIDFAGITQRAALSGAGGEALADALDVGLGI